MEQINKGWVISNENHPIGITKFLITASFASTRKKSIKLFCEGSGGNWNYWYRKYNFRCVKAESTISTID